MASVGMISEHRDILRKIYVDFSVNMQADQILPKMKDVFNDVDEDDINAERTERKRAEKMLDILPRKGEGAFTKFIEALRVVQPYLADHLAELAGLSLSPSVSTGNYVGMDYVGMDKVHQNILKKYVEQFKLCLDVEKMVESLVKEGVIHNTVAATILQQGTHPEQVEELILVVLPKCGPEAFKTFYSCLMRISPTFGHEMKNIIRDSHPNVALELVAHQESDKASSNSTSPSSNVTLTLSSPCSNLPEEVRQMILHDLDAPADELFGNDWRMLYNTLELPHGKEELIQKKEGSCTHHVINFWIKAKGNAATFGNLLSALQKCYHGDLVARIEKITGVEYKETNIIGLDVVEGIQNMQVDDKPVRFIGNIPTSLKDSFIKQLEAFDVALLGNIATYLTEKRIYVNNASDFLNKTKTCKMRFLFRKLREQQQVDIIKWMRDKLPPGSTGPLKDKDECRANHMQYLHRYEITKKLTAQDEWQIVAAKVGLTNDEIKLLNSRNKEPAEAVLSHWEVRSGTTVGALYDLLVDCGLYSVADML